MSVSVSSVFKNISLAAGIVIVTVTSCFAQSSTRLWQRAEAQNAKLAHLFAGRVQTHTDTYNSKGKLIGSSQSVHVFKELKGATPIRVRQSYSSSPGLKFDAPMGVEDVMDHPEKGLAKVDKYTLIGDENIAGAACQVFSIEGSLDEESGDRPRFKGKAWIESSSAQPVKVDYTVDVSEGPSSIKALKYSVAYDKKSMPVTISTELTVSMFFRRFTFVRQEALSDWMERSDPVNMWQPDRSDASDVGDTGS